MRETRKHLKNMLLWCVTAEVLVITALVMMIAAMTGGRTVVHMLIVVAICAWWIALFFQTNADIFDRRIRRAERKLIRALKKMTSRGGAQPVKNKRELKIVTFNYPY